jgi:hypothetical protein
VPNCSAFRKRNRWLWFLELARVLVRFDYVARGIVNALFLIETVLSR